jgi:hypothetical protein
MRHPVDRSLGFGVVVERNAIAAHRAMTRTSVA